MMKNLNRTKIQLKRISIFLVIFLFAGCSRTSTKFQKDADVIRLRHLKYYGELLEKYHRITGKYPFQGQKGAPVYVHIANDKQIEFTKQGPSYPHTVVPFKGFVKEIELVLGKEINEYYDPQYRPDYKPNFYIYMIHHDTYFFAVHVHQPYPFARKVAEHYYKIELSNHPNPQNQAVSLDQLLNSSEFQAELNRTVSKEAFFKERKDKYLHHTKSPKYSAGSHRDKFFQAIEAGDINKVSELLSVDSTLANCRDGNGATPLLIASCQNQGQIVQLLIDNKANIDDRWDGFTPLAQAIICGKSTPAKVFIENGAQLENINGSGQSALHLASQKGLNGIVALLVNNKGMSVNLQTQNEFGVTPLHDAALEGQLQTVKLLVKLGANVNKQSKDGWTALDDAVENNHKEIEAFLRTRGALKSTELHLNQ
ncbi:MAG: ankyrin repeat domain-containing protein [Planctomycetota bacterium]|jgi:hypothetical protein